MWRWEVPNVVGIKESSGLMTQITSLLTQAPRSFRVFAGDDALTLPTLAVGGVGVISVAANAIPQQMSHMVDAALTDNWIAARRINRHYFRLMQAHFSACLRRLSWWRISATSYLKVCRVLT